MIRFTDGYHDLPPGKIANIATFLEMRTPPVRQLAPWPADLHLERLNGSESSKFLEVFRAVGQDLMWYSRATMPLEKLEAILNHPDTHSFCVMQNGKPIGMLELDFRSSGECELAFFGLIPSYVGKGIGRALMDESIRRAWNSPIKRYFVHTCTDDHPGALAFYIRSGFVPYARKVEVADDPRLTGHLPRTAAPQIPIIEP